MSAPNAHYFESSESWSKLVNSTPTISDYLSQPYKPKVVETDRAHQLVEEGEWAKDHPPSSYGCAAHTLNFRVRDGADIPAKVYTPLELSASLRGRKLPILFVAHGGGFVQGTAVTEERWLIAPLMAGLHAAGHAMVVANVEYRRAPEHPHPIPLHDCEDVLKEVRADPASALGLGQAAVQADPDRIYFAGSSAGSCLAALLAQGAASKLGKASGGVEGVILNVPLVCHHDLFPADKFPWANSYQQAAEPGSTLLTLPNMDQVWQLYMSPDLEGEALLREHRAASPLLQPLGPELAPHALFVAGQDALRDEGLAYAQVLKEAGVDVEAHVYSGVPHIFGEIWTLPEAQQFQKDLVAWVLGRLEASERTAS